MEQVSKIISGQTLTSSQSQPNFIATIPTEMHAALFTLINKARLLNGWMMRPAAELDATIRVWAEMFTKYKIPVEAYAELYQRAFDTRQRKMQMAQDVPTMDATLLVSCWTGENGLMKERRIAADKQLNPQCDQVCPICFDTGKRVFNPGRGEPCPDGRHRREGWHED